MSHVRMCVFTIGVAFTVFSVSARPIEHGSPAFKLELPDEFVPMEGAAPARILYALQKPLPDGMRIALSIEDLGGTIGPEKLTKRDFQAAGVDRDNIDIEYWPLQRMQVNVLVARHTMPQGGVVSLAVQVPLNPRAIQITMAAPEAHEQEVRELLKGILGSFDGPLIAARLPDGQVVVTQKMPLSKRVVTLAWSVTGVGGWVALLSYWVFRLGIIGRADRFLRVRKNWLAVAGLGIFLGGAGRGIASTIYQQGDMLSTVLNLAVGALVINAHLRLAKRVKEQAAESAAACSSGEPVAVDAER